MVSRIDTLDDDQIPQLMIFNYHMGWLMFLHNMA